MADEIKPSWIYEHDMRVWEANRALLAAHIQAISSFATLAINSVILANSAAVGAVLAFIAAKSDGLPDHVLAPAVVSAKIFTVGIVAGMMSAAGSYFAQSFYSDGDGSKPNSKGETKAYRRGFVLKVIAVILAFIGIGAFGVGAMYGLEALGDLAAKKQTGLVVPANS